ncbi:MAG TPA: hypothetical protein DF984_01660 [Anaerolineaceae bacterium]|jgi:hypothetical protein|nr:hypothetical protein [Anaerolineaceae bacterium]
MDLIKVYTAAGELDAEMVKGFLEAQGIKVMLVQESIGRTYGLTVGMLGEVQLLVPNDQAEEARNIIEEMEDGNFEGTEYPA